jgi:CheY-like chemotaxis protein
MVASQSRLSLAVTAPSSSQSVMETAREAAMRRILVVDDKACGFRVATADGSANGLAALDDASFDLMIVDVFMPTMCGFESIRLFHQRAPTVSLIAISGYAFSGAEADDPACLKMVLNLGVTRCLRKPFRPSMSVSPKPAPASRVLSGRASHLETS